MEKENSVSGKNDEKIGERKIELEPTMCGRGSVQNTYD